VWFSSVKDETGRDLSQDEIELIAEDLREALIEQASPEWEDDESIDYRLSDFCW